jgi:hypothetical protein
MESPIARRSRNEDAGHPKVLWEADNVVASRSLGADFNSNSGIDEKLRVCVTRLFARRPKTGIR